LRRREGIGENVKRAVTVRLGRLASQAIAGDERSGNGQASSSASEAILCYLNAKHDGTPGWPYPRFLDRGARDENVELSLSIDDELWRALEDEAERQHISAAQMLEHALLYFASEFDAGRITERILDDIEESVVEDED
jgi:hypothetical protein